MPIKISAENDNEEQVDITIDRNPDYCPLCHCGVKPLLIKDGYVSSIMCGNTSIEVQVIYKCPRENCKRLFLGYYADTNEYNHYMLSSVEPTTPLEPQFSDHIKRISAKFCTIYTQARDAERRKLDEICGPGYGKALEFLIKDYLINEKGKDESTIKSTFLGKCIRDHVSDQRIKKTAERAAWLRNDESHYERVWADKDVKHLKKIIHMTIMWIEQECDYEELMEEMPDKKD